MVEVLAQLMAGGVSGAVGLLATHPLDTVRVRQQLPSSSEKTGVFRSLFRILGSEGVRAIYRGSLAPTLSIFAQNAIVFTVSRQCDGLQRDLAARANATDDGGARAQGRQLPLSKVFMSGVAAGFAVVPVCAPTELIKIRLQLQRGTQADVAAAAARGAKGFYSGNLGVLRALYAHGGVREVFRGTLVTFWRDVPSYGAYFFTYEFLRRNFAKTQFDGDIERVDEISPFLTMTAGGCAGIVSWAVSYPVDVVKTVIQEGRHNRIVDAFRAIIAESGVRGLFAGFNATMIRAFPNNAITFYAFEEIMRLYAYLQRT